jgi:hypothetical protein
LIVNPWTAVLAARRWIRKYRTMLREVRTHELGILAGRDLIASELRHNAVVVGRVTRGPEWRTVRDAVATERWRQYGGELSILRKRHPVLWTDLVDAYETLQKGVHEPNPGITKDALAALAERLAEAEL